ncbi:MAG: VWA domain-containing protein, partial [Bradymonadaceae bacterium]
MQFTAMPIQTVLMLAGVAAAFVTVLYILKLRKRRIEVPFSTLWNRVLTEKRSRTDWWRHLKRLLSWLLHIILVALLGFALLGPHFKDEVIQGRHILLLVDNSASMGAVDVSGGVDRLDIARRKAMEILDTVSGDDRVMLAIFNNRVQPLSPFVNEPSILEQPLREITVAATGTSFEQALSFAADSLKDKGQAELIVISDGAGFADTPLDTFDFGDETTVRHLKVGESSENLAVTAFNVRRYLANRLDYELFAQVQSFFDRPVEAELQLYADGRLVDTKALKLEANEVHRQFYPAQAVSGERLEARVRLKTRDARDVFPLDDSAFAILPATRQTRVQLVTEGNLFIEGPLLLNPNLEVTRVRPAAYDPARIFDVTIFDRYAPALPEEGNFVLFAPSGSESPFEINGVVDDPIITDVKRSHPLMRWLTMTDLNIARSAKFTRRAGDDVVASSFGTPIIIARQDGNRQVVAIGFDVR